MTEYTTRSGNKVSAGNFYRELGRLAADGLVETGVNPPDADARRIPYRIKEKGRHVIDRWLTSPSIDDGDFAIWLLFADRADADARVRVIERREEALWMRSKMLTRLRDDALANRREPRVSYDPLPSVLSRQMKQIAAELDFLSEFRLDFDAWLRVSEVATNRGTRIDAGGAGGRGKRGGSKP